MLYCKLKLLFPISQLSTVAGQFGRLLGNVLEHAVEVFNSKLELAPNLNRLWTDVTVME